LWIGQDDEDANKRERGQQRADQSEKDEGKPAQTRWDAWRKGHVSWVNEGQPIISALPWLPF
jgi:hypothetical protein